MTRKVLLAFVFCFSLPLIPANAQDVNTVATGAPGCGNPEANFSVDTVKGAHPSQPDAGKALVYIIENDSNFNSVPKPTTRDGLDGKWVGATHGNSYLYFLVDPGVHHLCASWQKAVLIGKGRRTAAAHFTANAGGVYYFEVKNEFFESSSSEVIDVTLAPIDSDEGQILVSSFSLSNSSEKK